MRELSKSRELGKNGEMHAALYLVCEMKRLIVAYNVHSKATCDSNSRKKCEASIIVNNVESIAAAAALSTNMMLMPIWLNLSASKSKPR